MKITVKLKSGGKAIAAKLPYEGAKYVTTDAECPSKGHYLDVAGGDPNVGHNTIEAPAVCCACKEHVGTIVVKVSTIFGIEEDARVLNGRCRVY